MTEDFYLSQIKRLQIHFGAKAFNSETVKIFAREVAPVSNEFFRDQVDRWIGTKKHTEPPRLAEFKESKLAFDKRSFVADCRKASEGFNNGLKEVLRKVYKVDSLKEAFEMERLKARLGDKDGGST